MKLLILISLAFFSCSSSNGSYEEKQEPSSSSVADTPSSSSIVQNSSSSGGFVGETFTDSRDGQTYRIVTIGGKKWMAENLNFQTINSMCLNRETANCEKYGKYYNWDDAMNACPVGWRLPSNKDWEDLVQAVGGANVAGKKLKTTTEWCFEGQCGNGTDEFGFSAMAANFIQIPVPVASIGYTGNWWSSARDELGWAYFWSIYFGNDEINNQTSEHKFRNGYSIRCVEGENIGISKEHFNSNITYSSFTDSRDGKNYRTVTIDGKKWMAENLNYATDNSWCYANGYCTEYGRLYTWNAAKEACPEGWRLPEDGDWEDLIETVGDGLVVGGKLKSKTGWTNNGVAEMGISGNGTDEFGFSAIPGGFIASDIYSSVGSCGAWWSATEIRRSSMGPNGVVSWQTAQSLKLYGSDERAVLLPEHSLENALSVRCVEGE